MIDKIEIWWKICSGEKMDKSISNEMVLLAIVVSSIVQRDHDEVKRLLEEVRNVIETRIKPHTVFVSIRNKENKEFGGQDSTFSLAMNKAVEEFKARCDEPMDPDLITIIIKIESGNEFFVDKKLIKILFEKAGVSLG